MALVDGRSPDRAVESIRPQLDADVVSPAVDAAILDADAKALAIDSSTLVNLDAVFGSHEDTAPQNQSLDLLPALPIDTASDSSNDVADSSPTDIALVDVTPDSAVSDLTNADTPVLPPPPICDWRVDNTSTLGDLPFQQRGKPYVIDTPTGPSVCFNGQKDGLVRASTPLTGLRQFTLQILLRSDQEDLEETHVMHIEEATNSRHRLAIETRSTASGTWYPRVFMRWDDRFMEIDNPIASFPSGSWYWLALSFDGNQARLFVNGVETASSQSPWGPMGEASFSLGMRLNKQGFFPGCVAQIIVSSIALPADALRVP